MIKREIPQKRTPKEILQAEGVRIIEPETKVEAPQSFNEGVLSALGINEQFRQAIVTKIVDFLNFPLMIDSFGENHADRREWRATLSRQHGDEIGELLLHGHKLLGNNFASFVGVLEAIESMAPEKSSDAFRRISTLSQQAREAYNGYNTMTLDDKIETARKFDLICHEILDILTN